MTPIATAENTSSNVSHAAAARAHAVPSTNENTGARTLRDAIQAVTDHQREVEMRRMAAAARHRAPSDDWLVPVPRARLLALEQQAHQAAALLELVNSGAVAPAGTLPPPHERLRPPKPNQRSRLDARPSSSA